MRQNERGPETGQLFVKPMQFIMRGARASDHALETTRETSDMGTFFRPPPTLAAAIVLASTLAAAQEPTGGTALKVVTVTAPAINCVYRPTCTVNVADSAATLTLASLDKPGPAYLESRTFAGAAGAPGAGKTGYEYRLDMTQASGAIQCVAGVVINFGPVTQLPFKNDMPADVYVVTQGGAGTVGLSSAEQDGDVITFIFDKLLCPSASANAANTTFLFGLASAHPPTATTAGVFAVGNPPYSTVAVRAPQH